MKEQHHFKLRIRISLIISLFSLIVMFHLLPKISLVSNKIIILPHDLKIEVIDIPPITNIKKPVLRKKKTTDRKAATAKETKKVVPELFIADSLNDADLSDNIDSVHIVDDFDFRKTPSFEFRLALKEGVKKYKKYSTKDPFLRNKNYILSSIRKNNKYISRNSGETFHDRQIRHHMGNDVFTVTIPVGALSKSLASIKRNKELTIVNIIKAKKHLFVLKYFWKESPLNIQTIYQIDSINNKYTCNNLETALDTLIANHFLGKREITKYKTEYYADCEFKDLREIICRTIADSSVMRRYALNSKYLYGILNQLIVE